MSNKNSAARGAVPAAALSALGVIGLLGAAVPRADADPPPSSITIPLAGLDLTQKGDAAELYSRITRAAVQACGPYDSRSSYEQERMQVCVKASIAAAVERVNKPALVALVRRPEGR